jgi:hypothetical protein
MRGPIHVGGTGRGVSTRAKPLHLLHSIVSVAKTIMTQCRTTRAIVLGIVGIFASAGCRSVVSCDASAVPAIRLAVHDALTGAAIPSQMTIVWTEHGAPPDTIVASGADLAGSGIPLGLRPGTYDLVVRSPGYAVWSETVDVGSVGCKPNTIGVKATLQKLP